MWLQSGKAVAFRLASTRLGSSSRGLNLFQPSSSRTLLGVGRLETRSTPKTSLFLRNFSQIQKKGQHDRSPSINQTTLSETDKVLISADDPQNNVSDGRIITPATLRKRFRKNLFRLIKLELNALVCVTSAAGYLLGGGSLFEPLTLASVCLGTMSLSITASVLNQLWERDHDAKMNRTRTRPLVTGYFSTQTAVSVATGCLGLGTGLLWMGTTPQTTILGLATVGLYALVYTPMKRFHRWNTEVGAVVGALPPIMGWLASPGHSFVSPEAFLLGSLLYSWQMSHFMCICWNSRADYARAGYQMISHPDFDPSGIKTVRKGMAWVIAMSCLPFISTLLELTTPMFMVSCGAVNLYFCYVYWQFFRQRLTNPASSRRALRWGFLQLLLFMVLMVFHLKDRDNIRAYADMQKLRDLGYTFCLHRYESMQSAWKRAFCPFVAPPPALAAGIESVESESGHENTPSHSAACPMTKAIRQDKSA